MTVEEASSLHDGNELHRRFAAVRKSEFRHLKDTAYFDSAGAPMYPQSLIHDFDRMLATDTFGNPHSANPASQRTHKVLEHVRAKVLEFVDASEKEYDVILTANATAAFKLVADNFSWHPPSSHGITSNIGIPIEWNIASGLPAGIVRFWRSMLDLLRKLAAYTLYPPQLTFLADNHTSALGIRSVYLESFVKVNVASAHGLLQSLRAESLMKWLSPFRTNSLFVYPLQSNFNGRQYPLEWIDAVKSTDSPNHRQFVMVDAVSFCSSSRLSLSKFPADFVALSFYKVFGFPTGLGALVVRKESAGVLRKKYFGGGTVRAISYASNWQVFNDGLASRFEDGTLNFHGIIGLKLGFDTFERLYGRLENVHGWLSDLSEYAATRLAALQYRNGNPVCLLYRDDTKPHGPIIAFNILSKDGTVTSCSDFEIIANEHDISVRSGSFCNPGALYSALGISDDMVFKRLVGKGRVCGTGMPYEDGTPAGTIRISLGPYNTYEDVERLIKVIEDYYIVPETGESLNSAAASSETGIVTRITVFPIKSCGGFDVDRWPVTNHGLEYDRFWRLQTGAGHVMTQKRYPQLARVKCQILNRQLIVSTKETGSIIVGFDADESERSIVNAWFTSSLGLQCELVKSTDVSEASFSNQAPFLLVNSTTFGSLLNDPSSGFDITSFRGNIEAEFPTANIEDTLRHYTIGSTTFEAIDKCKRCTVINVNQDTGERGSNMYLDLYKSNSSRDGVYFGRYLLLASGSGQVICVGDSIVAK